MRVAAIRFLTLVMDDCREANNSAPDVEEEEKGKSGGKEGIASVRPAWGEKQSKGNDHVGMVGCDFLLVCSTG